MKTTKQKQGGYKNIATLHTLIVTVLLMFAYMDVATVSYMT